MKYDIAKTLRKHGFVAVDAAFELWRQGVSTKDIALAPLLPDAQRFDLISAVDQLVNTPTLDNQEEKIMRIPGSKMDRSCDYITESPDGVMEDDQEDVGDLKAAFESSPGTETPDAELEDDEAALGHAKDVLKDTPSDEDTARLHVALKDLHNGQEGEGFVQNNALDPDRERLTGVDHILNKTESPDTDTLKLALEDIPPLQHNIFRWHPSIRKSVYKLINGERDYQSIKFDQSEKLKWTPNDWLTLMDRYMINALDVIADPDAQMVEIRKIAALAVAAMEHIATPARV